MLESLHRDIRVLTQESGATPSEIATLKSRFPTLPDLLADLMLDATELELSYRGRYLRLYGPRGCIEMDNAYGISDAIPTAITIGDNGGGEAIVLVENTVYRIGYGALAPDELNYIASSVDELLILAKPNPDAIGGCLADA